MPSRRAQKVALDARRRDVARLYARGWRQEEIAQELGVTQGTICTDLKAIRQQWRASAIRDFDALREEELRGLEEVKREAWQAWERSKKPQQEATVDGEAPHQKTRKRIRNQNGDPRYLDIVLRCKQARRALLGLDAPTKIAPTTPEGQPLSFEQRQSIIAGVMTERYGLAEVRNFFEARSSDDPGSLLSDAQWTLGQGSGAAEVGEEGPAGQSPAP